MNFSNKYLLKSLKLLYIDDKNIIPEHIINTLNLFFLDVFYANNLDYASEIFDTKKPNIIISETNIQSTSVLSFLNSIRQYNENIPIIITSKTKNYEDFISLIKLQVVDFIEKPIDSGQIIYALNKSAKKITNGITTILLQKNVHYNFNEKILSNNKKIYKLTNNEYRFIELLILNRNKPLSKQYIEFNLWGDKYVSDSALKSLLKRLRDKINLNLIQNIPTQGYYIT